DDGAFRFGLQQGCSKCCRNHIKAELLELAVEVVRGEVAVGVGCHPGVGVTHDALDDMEWYAGLHIERCGRVPQVMEADGPDERDRPEKQAMDGAPTRLAVPGPLSMLARHALSAPASVLVAQDQASASHRTPQGGLGLHV